MKIASNGIHIEVNDQGSGTPAIVFLHYWGGSSRTWSDVIAALPSSYRTVALDHRGWGNSDAPAKGYALADFADDAQGVIESIWASSCWWVIQWAARSRNCWRRDVPKDWRDW